MNQRIERLMGKLPHEVDCALIMSDINRRYFTGMRSTAGTLVCFRDAAYLIIDFRYIEKAQKTVKGCEVLQQDNLYAQLKELLLKHGAKCTAVEAMEMTLSQFAQLREKLGDCTELEDSGALSKAVYACRMVKEPQELEKIRSAQQLAEEAFSRILTFIRPGVTEREIQMELDFAMIRLGAEDLSFPTIALTGASTSMPHGVPSEKKVEKGDFVLMDYGAVVDGYHSDMTRTVAVGQPSEEMEKVYRVVLEAQMKSLDAVCAGITGQQLDAVARTHIAEAGYGAHFGHSLGHGVGLEIHEYPNASPTGGAVLRPGNVITIEPGIYLPGKFGVRIEDFAAVTEMGCENLTKAPKELIIL
ncbi:MAG: aminopeptidase P family protein [Ruminococcus sp.]|nr:aminopeptidase P family protein [Ruminococcus sp.]